MNNINEAVNTDSPIYKKCMDALNKVKSGETNYKQTLDYFVNLEELLKKQYEENLGILELAGKTLRKLNSNKQESLQESEDEHKYDLAYRNANEGRRKRIERYRKLTGLNESDEITDDHIEDNKWFFNKICSDTYCDPNRLRAELKGEKWSDYEV